MIQTVTGPRDSLGFCHSHEHLCIEPGRSAQVYAPLRIDEPEKTLRELLLFRAAGGRAVVDAQPVGCGRNAEVLRALSEQSGVDIIASTGFHKPVFYPESHWLFRYSERRLADLFITELRSGMYVGCDAAEPARTCPVKAGQIKTALDENPFAAHMQKCFGAAAEASLETGAPIMVHVEKNSDPQALAEFLKSRGVCLNKVIFCHMDRAVPALETHQRLCEMGAYMEYDTIARPKYHDDDSEVAIIAEMVRRGFENQILMGLDVTRERYLSYGGSVGLAYILETFLPKLLEKLTPQQTDLFFVQNPSRVFSFGGANR